MRINSLKINDLKEYIAYLENENSELVEEVNDFLNQKEIKTFCNGKYTDELRMIYYELMSMNVSVHNCGNVIRSVLKRLGNLNVGHLPKKSAASIMMVESCMLALMQAGEAIAESESNVLHLDGTKLNFEEIGSFQVVTDSGAYTFGIEDMMSGEAQWYFETFRDILKEASALLTSPQECEGKASVMLATIKNVMTDRCATNASFVEQLKSWRNEVLPTVIDNFDDLSDEEKVTLTRLNHLFCSIHVVHNSGIYSENAVKEWEKIAAVLSRHGGFQSSDSRTYDMLFKISKLCSYTHGDQRNGKAKEWRAYLENNNLPNKIISILHHRFNVYFVLGGAVYFHRNHLKDLLTTLGSDNFLLTSILSDIDNKLYLAAFRSFGYF